MLRFPPWNTRTIYHHILLSNIRSLSSPSEAPNTQAHEGLCIWLVFQVTRVDADVSDSQHGRPEGDWRALCSSPALLVFYFPQATANTGWENCAPVGFMWGCLFTQVLSYCCRSGKLPATFYGHWMRCRQQPEAVLFYSFHDFETTALSVGGQCQDLLGVLTREEELGTRRAALCRQMIRVQFG